MALFNFGKKKEEKKVPACACSCGCPTEETIQIVDERCVEVINGLCSIKVLGSGCASCHQLYEYAKEAAKNMGLSVDVEYITDMAKVMGYGVMSMPALVVNEKVVSMGKVVNAVEIEKMIKKL